MIITTDERNGDICVGLEDREHIKIKSIGKKEKKYILVNQNGEIKLIPLKEKEE